MKTIFMINGKKRGGKDYFSDMLVDKKFVKVALAKKLKDAACKAASKTFDEMEEMKNNEGQFILHYDTFIDDCKEALFDSAYELNGGTLSDEEYNQTLIAINRYDFSTMTMLKNDDDTIQFDARIFLQEIGGVWKVVFGNDNVWTDLLIQHIKTLENDQIIISDYRYPYEYEGIKAAFKDDYVKTVKVLGKNLYDTDKYDTHTSETALNDSKFDFHINNTFWHSGSLFWQAQGLMQVAAQEIEDGTF